MAKLEAQNRNLKADLRATTQETMSWSAVIPQLQAELAAELSQANEAAVTTRSQLEDQVSELQFSLQVTFLHSSPPFTFHPPSIPNPSSIKEMTRKVMEESAVDCYRPDFCLARSY